MVPIAFDEENYVIDVRAGSSWPIEVEPIPVRLCRMKDTGIPIIVSCFKVTKEELEEIKRTGRVWMLTFGPSMNYTKLVVSNPFTYEDLEGGTVSVT